MDNIYLSVIIATHSPAGTERVSQMNLPHIEGVEYIVSWQKHGNTPVNEKIARRNDIKVFRCEQPGLSNNRNNALDHASGTVCLNADNDISYTAEQLSAVMDTFRNNPSLEFALFRYNNTFGKRYPAEITSIYSLPKWHQIASIEIAFRRDICAKHPKMRFNPDFGLGAPYLTAGEDNMFFLTAKACHLNGYFFPITITTHPDLPTGRERISNTGVIRATGAIITLMHPFTFPPRLVVNAFRIAKSGRAPLLTALTGMFAGAIHAITKKRIRTALKV